MSWHKYKAKKQNFAGRSFDSKGEASLMTLLMLRQRAGEFVEIQQQDSVYLTDARILYRPDFKCTKPDESFLWVEFKGFETRDWRIKRRLWIHYGPGPLEIWKGSYSASKLHEIIIPKTNIIKSP